ncbi:carboxypeptidase regulatory-like domain-containing protein [Variovorax sp. IB41]|uniref:carboxypeptidase regulatory-like domain-containing protein n=1 Tax=Variovorax sp. IB41 TaxID=2779370 RepID=UPI0018E6E46A|nr:carboxypeptidase regulatory-like domain-containing protein [Variovorax sp. IB41]MBJ2160375.1 carboxypeptidase regulatory-like domain-containing protein [Variovorax sp. IB41]
MPHLTRKIPHALSIVTLALLAACGGGGGGGGGGGFGFIPPASGGNGGGDPPAAASTTLSGTVATGAAFAGAALTVFDQTGAKVCEVTTTPEGTYTCTLPAGTKAPLVIQAVRDDLTLYSTTASTATGTTNVTPLTTIIVAQLAPNGDPSKLAAAIQADAGAVTAGSISDKVAKLVAALQPLLDALNMSIDPMSGEFQANGSGQDRVLDTISVSVRPDGAAANIEITVKGQPTDDASKPVSLVFRSDDATIEPVQGMATISLGTAPPTPAMVQALLERINACYALPLNQRVNSPINQDGNAFGTAANVVAPECRTLFVGDSPENFVAAGVPIGRVAGGARRSFDSLFRFGPTNLKHDRGNFEYFYKNGDIALTYRWTDILGNTDNDVFNARVVDGALKLTGNADTYRAFVRPQLEKKDYLKHQNLVFHSVGYALSVDNVRDGMGNPILAKVVATTESLPGRQLVLVPKSGLNSLVLTPDGTIASGLNSSIWRMSARYLDPAQTGSPNDFENANLFASPFIGDDDLRKIPDQTVWKLEFFRADGVTPNVVQYVRTFSRVPTIAEAVQTPLVELVPAVRADLLAESQGSARGIVFGPTSLVDPNNADFSADGNLDAWVVPNGALAPTSFSVFGRAPGPSGARFSETVTVRNTNRKAIVYCVPVAPLPDAHCAPANNNSYQYAEGSSLSTFTFVARTARQVDVRKNFEVWTVTP